MNLNEHIKYWVESANHDMESLNALYLAHKFDWALFIGHLVIEKLLKAHYVRNNESKIPPKLHNLIRLAEIAGLELSDEMKLILDKINDFNIEVRYPQYKNEFYKTCTKEFADEQIAKIKEIYEWLVSQLK